MKAYGAGDNRVREDLGDKGESTTGVSHPGLMLQAVWGSLTKREGKTRD